jgi:hypothetical protein
MGRSKKEILIECGKDRRATGYYSTPPQIAKYLTRRLLEINPNGKNVVDPCVGREELLNEFYKAGKVITGVDIHGHSNHKLCKFICTDFLGLYAKYKKAELLRCNVFDPLEFDYWIANPPYNCHEVDYIKNNKKHLSEIFEDVGVHNMYSMFISSIIDMAKNDAVIGIITLDSFLTSKAHTALRKKIISETTILDVILCPTDLFLDQSADVRTCLLVMVKGKPRNVRVNLLNRVTLKEDFYSKLEKRAFASSELNDILLTGNRDNFEFMIDVPKRIKALFENKRIGELFNCVTGISTGDDKIYLSSEKKDGYNIPFYKNPGSRKFYCTEDAYLIDSFLDVSRTVSNFMVRNTNVLFKPGITCSSMGVEFSACYLPQNSAFGVNPNIICEENDIWWLLGYMNSDLVKFIVRGVLIRTNMVTSGYISRLPVPDFSLETKGRISELAKDAYELAKTGKSVSFILEKINSIINHSIKLDDETKLTIKEFCLQIVKRT